jgi:ABC-type multidrug transport system ATPase subunit
VKAPSLTVSAGGTDYVLAPATAWSLCRRNDRLVVEPFDEHSNGVVGVFTFFMSWCFQPTAPDPSLTVAGQPLGTTMLILSTSEPVAVVDQRRSAPALPAPPQPPFPGPARPASRNLSIGRVGTGADIEVDDPTVLASHAVAKPTQQGRWLVYKDSGQLLVEGRARGFADLGPSDHFVVGQTTFVIPDDGRPPEPVRQRPTTRGVHIEARLVTAANREKILIRDASFDIGADCCTFVIGPSGAGKSSLVALLLGGLDIHGGTVLFDGASAGELLRLPESLVRYVPQSDNLYPSLTVAETLRFGARCRLARDMPRSEVRARIDEVAARVSLSKVMGTLVGTGDGAGISGGERHRLSMALELLGQPRLLMLDEPTSGLDLGKERQVLAVLRKVAREGCTVVCVTHTLGSLTAADQIIALNQGGRIAYAGPLERALTHLGHNDWADAMDELGSYPPAPRIPRIRRRNLARGLPLPGHLGMALQRQAVLLCRRGVASLAASAAVPIGGAAVLAAAVQGGFAPTPEAGAFVSIGTTLAALSGLLSTTAEVVTQMPILRRDWRVGVPARSVIGAKAIAFAGVAATSMLLMAAVFVALRGLPSGGLTGVPTWVVMTAPWVGVAMASMAMGLLLSALATSLERAMTYGAIAAVAQVVLTGTAFNLPRMLAPVTAVLPARWGVGAGASWIDLNQLRPTSPADALWTPDAIHFWVALVALAALTVLYSVAASVVLERRWEKQADR